MILPSVNDIAKAYKEKQSVELNDFLLKAKTEDEETFVEINPNKLALHALVVGFFTPRLVVDSPVKDLTSDSLERIAEFVLNSKERVECKAPLLKTA